MDLLYPELEPHDRGLFDDGHRVCPRVEIDSPWRDDRMDEWLRPEEDAAVVEPPGPSPRVILGWSAMPFPRRTPARTPPDEYWRRLLSGELPALDRSRRLLGSIPSTPRCKLCNAPFGNPGSAVMRMIGGGPSQLNRRICRFCIRKLEKFPGGTELEISLLFADVRGSTALAEGMPPNEFSRLLAGFYGTAARIVDRWDGIVDKFVGDEVVALFIPSLSGNDHVAKALAAARDLLGAQDDEGDEPSLPIGASVHTGVSFVGVVGEGDAYDFTAVGDVVNTGSRLASLARAGEILVSSAAADAAGLERDGLDERRTVDVRGREEPVDVLVLRP